MITYREVLNGLAFIFTILIITYAINKGMDDLELGVKVIYFTVLLLSQVENLKDVVFKKNS